MSQENDIEIKGHDYDGIKEYDNPLPGWWLVTFYATIIFSFIYVIHYEFGGGPDLGKELGMAMAQIEQLKAKAPKGSLLKEDELIAKVNNPDIIAKGSETFQSKCSSCHGNQLQGLVGPNLTDKYWLKGKGLLSDIVSTVKSGTENGMPPWEGILKEDEIIAVAGFIKSKKDSNPPNPKAPQGNAVE